MKIRLSHQKDLFASSLDNSLSDQEFYNRLLQSENIDISKPENKGRKGAITELIRDVMRNITDDVDITK